MAWTIFCKRTEDPKLAYIEARLGGLGIPHQRNGYSFHAPILEVPEDRLAEADALLNEPVDMGDGTTQRLDDLEDDDVLFAAYAEGGESLWTA